MNSLIRSTLVSLFSLCITFSAWADPLKDAEVALKKRDVLGAIRILEQATSEGNIAAKGMLSSYLRTLPAPHRNTERACTLAKEASDVGDPMGSTTRAECLISGAEKSEQPVLLARDLARKALKAGNPSAGFILYIIYTADPKYGYSEGGSPNLAKYNALASMPISERIDQVEAFDGLTLAMRAGHVNAMKAALAYLLESSAPENISRAIGLTNLLQNNGEQIPQFLIPLLRVAQDTRHLGKTHNSALSVINVQKSASLAAKLQMFGLAQNECDNKEIKITKIEAEPIANPEYLPIAQLPLAKTYLIRGTWSENWTFSGCNQSTVIRIDFSADGWSGVKFQASPKLAKDAKN